jgi:AcrR family transcriptional regulator
MTSDERSDRFADAALRIVERDGLAALSFRSVAAESGWSLGAVQKAFATKQDLLQSTLERAQSTVTSSVSSRPAQPDLQTWLCDLVLETLPLDTHRRAAVIVGVAFADRAPFDDAIAHELRKQATAMRAQLIRLFGWCRSEGELEARLDDESLARAVLAFAGGLASELLYSPSTDAEVEALVNATIRALLAQ